MNKSKWDLASMVLDYAKREEDWIDKTNSLEDALRKQLLDWSNESINWVGEKEVLKARNNILHKQLKIALVFFDGFQDFVHKGGDMTTLEMYREITETKKRIEQTGKKK